MIDLFLNRRRGTQYPCHVLLLVLPMPAVRMNLLFAYSRLFHACNPRLNRLIDEALPNSKLEILPDLKHSILLEAGSFVGSRLVEFITALPVNKIR